MTHFIIKILAFFLLPSRKKRILANEIRLIFVYAQMGIGNMVLFTPFLKSIRNHFKEAKIILLFLSRNGAEQVLEGSPLIDEIIILDVKKLSYFKRLKKIVYNIEFF